METQQTSSTQQGELGPRTTVVIRIELKPERVQEPQALAAEGEGKVITFELTVHNTQPVTVELAEPKVTITLYGNPEQAALAA